MATTNWIKRFGKLALVDVNSVPARLRYRIQTTIAAFFVFQQKKICEEERAELEIEAVMIEQKWCQQRIRDMEWLTHAMPGATVNDYETFIERRPFWSLMLLRTSFWRLVLGTNDKEGG
jgi:hypothetical protein